MLPRGRMSLVSRIQGRLRARPMTVGGVPSFLQGVFPVWHASQTSPNVAGAISGLADISTTLYPLGQGTGGFQPVRSGGAGAEIVTFDGIDDYMFLSSLPATYADNCHAWTLWVVAKLDPATPGTTETIIALGSTATNNNYAAMRHNTGDKLELLRGDGAGGSLVYTSTANMDATQALYIIEGTGGALQDTVASYKDGVITAGAPTNGAISNYTTNRLGLGAFVRAAVNTYFNGSIRAAGALDRVLTANERTLMAAWAAANCPV